MKKVSLIIPAYNEEESLPMFYEVVNGVCTSLSDKYEFEFLFINDGSMDCTEKVLRQLRDKDKRVCFLNMSRNFGKEAGMLAGFDHVKGDCAITIDADLQEPPEIIPLMLERWEEGYDDVYGRRRQRCQSFIKKRTSRIYHKLLARISNVDLRDDSGDFRLLDRKCIEALKQLRESQRYTKGMYAWIGFKKAPVDYDIAERYAGTTKWTPSKLIGLALNGVTSHSIQPLRMASYLGFIVSSVAFLYLIYVIGKAVIVGEEVQGYPTIVCLVLFLGGVVLLALGIIGEYLGRMFLETKQRPPYILRNSEGVSR